MYVDVINLKSQAPEQGKCQKNHQTHLAISRKKVDGAQRLAPPWCLEGGCSTWGSLGPVSREVSRASAEAWPPLLSWMEARGCPSLGRTSWKHIPTIPSARYPFHPVLPLPPFIPKHQGPLCARLCVKYRNRKMNRI